MQALRSAEPPARAHALAQELGVSQRTLYRDIDELRALGAVIEGEAGFGYTLQEDATLPPLGFEAEEIEALVLGLREVAEIADPSLARAAQSALKKIHSRLPKGQAHRLKHAVLDARRFHKPHKPGVNVSTLRRATWDERVIRFDYKDAKGQSTQRSVQPLSIVFMSDAHVLLSWCLLRADFRAFRLDRMQALFVTNESFRPKRVPLLRAYIAELKGGMRDS